MRPPAFGGLLVAALFLAASLTPSLLPRHWTFQAIVVGILTAAGYGIGALAGSVLGRLVTVEFAPSIRRRAWRVLGIVAILGTAGVTVWAIGWQQRLHRLMGMPVPAGGWYVLAVLLGLALAVLLVAGARGDRWLTRKVRDWFARWLPPAVASVAGVVLVTVVIVGLLDGLVNQVLFAAADETFRLSDRAVDGEMVRPSTPLRSGSRSSLVSWEVMGSQGRDFVSGGPRLGDIARFHPGPVSEPIRLYVGLEAGRRDRARVQLAIDELDRTGAFDRDVLCVITTTGTGWVDPDAAAALEYLWAGDTALVTVQYSYLPSWLSFLVDSRRARHAGAALFDAVHERWEELPEDERPLLLVFGESLGADGSEAAFSGIADLRNRTDGALWVGQPNFSELWRRFTRGRDPGTPERLPTYEGGRTVRFAAETADLHAPPATWEYPRVVYLQHPSDPVVWWSPRLILRRPDWLKEPQGSDVLPDMRWYPLVTFWQLTADLANAERVPPGHGHGYGPLVGDAWAAIAAPPDWTEQDTQRLRAVLDRGSAPWARATAR